MQRYRVETTISPQGDLLIHGVPFPPGDHVEVLICEVETPTAEPVYPLRGTPYEYQQPFDSVAESEWGA